MCVKRIIYPILMLCILSVAFGWRFVPELSKEKNIVKIKDDNPVKRHIPPASELIDEQVRLVFQEGQLEDSGLTFDVFRKAYIGFINLQTAGEISATASKLSIADFSLSSKEKRLWVVDINTKQLLLNTWVSHGQGSGADLATSFSNTINSHQSSLGFYVTGEVYNGKHGRSLRLDGMDAGFNSKARERAIVMHGADYVSSTTIKNLNRLGRSHGCPAVPSALSNKIIDLIKGRSVLYIHANLPSYHSRFLDEENAGRTLLASFLNEDTSTQLGNL